MNSASFDSQNYTAFKNADVSGLSITTGNASGTSLNYKDGLLTAEHAAYILDTDTSSVIQIKAGEDLSDYMDVSDDKTAVSMKDQYRMLDEVVVNETTTAAQNTATGQTIADSLGKDISKDATNKVDDIMVGTEFKLDESAKKLYDADGKEVSGVALNKYFDGDGQYTGGLYADSQATQSIDGQDGIKDYITKSYGEVTADLSFSLHVGADSARTNKLETNIQSMSAASLGIDKLKSTSVGIVDKTGNNATDAIDVIANALQKVSTQRSALGAVQNRLEHTIKNLDNVVENTISAESAIRDTDMATEMVKYSNANILSQAGQSMLAQANQSNQGVLSIIG